IAPPMRLHAHRHEISDVHVGQFRRLARPAPRPAVISHRGPLHASDPRGRGHLEGAAGWLRLPPPPPTPLPPGDLGGPPPPRTPSRVPLPGARAAAAPREPARPPHPDAPHAHGPVLLH